LALPRAGAAGEAHHTTAALAMVPDTGHTLTSKWRRGSTGSATALARARSACRLGGR